MKARKPDYKLDTLQSSIIIEMFKVINHAYEVFEDEDKAQAWLSRPNKALFGHIPAELLASATGLIMVEDVLTRIEEGVYS